MMMIVHLIKSLWITTDLRDINCIFNIMIKAKITERYLRRVIAERLRKKSLKEQDVPDPEALADDKLDVATLAPAVLKLIPVLPKFKEPKSVKKVTGNMLSIIEDIVNTFDDVEARKNLNNKVLLGMAESLIPAMIAYTSYAAADASGKERDPTMYLDSLRKRASELAKRRVDNYLDEIGASPEAESVVRAITDAIATGIKNRIATGKVELVFPEPEKEPEGVKK